MLLFSINVGRWIGNSLYQSLPLTKSIMHKQFHHWVLVHWDQLFLFLNIYFDCIFLGGVFFSDFVKCATTSLIFQNYIAEYHIFTEWAKHILSCQRRRISYVQKMERFQRKG